MANKVERFTPIARKLLSYAQELTEEFGNNTISVEFFFLAMTVHKNTNAFIVLDEFDIVETKLRPFIRGKFFSQLDPLAKNIQVLDLSDESKEVLQLAVNSAGKQELSFVGTASILIGMLRLESDNIDTTLKHFDVQRKDIIKRAEYYAVQEDTLEYQTWQKYLAREGSETKGCIASIRNMIGLNDDR